MAVRCLILIDGNDFFFKMKKLQLRHLLTFDFTAFKGLLCRDASIVKATYVVGAVRTNGTAKTKKLHADQQRLLQHLTSHHYRYVLGTLSKSGVVLYEKGVDVAIAVALLTAVYEDLADRILIASSDVSLLPVIQRAQRRGKVVEYIGFAGQVNKALAAKCMRKRILTRDHLRPLLS